MTPLPRSPRSLLSPRSPLVRHRRLTLSIPFLDRLARVLISRYGLFLPPHCPPWRRGLLTFLWLWRAEFSYRAEPLPGCPSSSSVRELRRDRLVRGLRLTLQTPLAGLDFSYRHPNWDSLDLQTSLTLSWWPVAWWRLKDGQQVFRHGHTWEWSRWRREGRMVAERDQHGEPTGRMMVESWLERRERVGAPVMAPSAPAPSAPAPSPTPPSPLDPPPPNAA